MINCYDSILCQIFDLAQLLFREQLLQGKVCASHELEPFCDLEFFLYHKISSMGESISPTMALLAYENRSLQAELYASKETNWYLCQT